MNKGSLSALSMEQRLWWLTRNHVLGQTGSHSGQWHPGDDNLSAFGGTQVVAIRAPCLPGSSRSTELGAVMPHRAGNCVWGLCMLRLLHFCPEVCVLMGFTVQKPLV